MTIVQQLTERTPLGRVHRFRFYGPDGFFPEIRLSGKRIAFADHVLQRFSQRVGGPPQLLPVMVQLNLG
jgi:predicted ester cyclase